MDNLRRVKYNTSVICGDYEWFVSVEIQVLFKKHIDTKKVYFVTYIDSTSQNDAAYFFCDLYTYNNKIIGIPFQADSIFVYDIEKELLDRYPLGEYKKSLFSNSVQIKSKIYCIPSRYEKIVCFDCDTLSLQDVFDFKKKEYIAPYTMRAVQLYGEKIMVGCFNSNDILVIDNNNKTETIKIDSDANGWVHMIIDNNIMYLMDRRGNLIIYDINTGSDEKYIIDNYNDEYCPIYGMVKDDNFIYLASSYLKKIYKWDIANKRLESEICIKDGNKVRKEMRSYCWYDFLWIKNESINTIKLYDLWSGKVLEIDKNNMSLINKNDENILDEVEYEKLLFGCNDKMFNEELWGLNSYIKLI